MSLFAVRKNGQLTLNGSVTINGSQTVTGTAIANQFQTVGTGGSFYVNTRGGLLSSADGTVALMDFAASTFATAQVKSVNFMVPASTFAATATITNGPRAANPVSWVEVFVAGSSGRVPVW